MRSIKLRRPSASMAVSFAALSVALGGTSYAAVQLPKNSVGAAQIKAAAVQSTEIKDGAVGSGDVKDGSLLGKDFKAGQLPAGPRQRRHTSEKSPDPRIPPTAHATARRHQRPPPGRPAPMR